jgi:hypothetical protein
MNRKGLQTEAPRGLASGGGTLVATLALRLIEDEAIEQHGQFSGPQFEPRGSLGGRQRQAKAAPFQSFEDGITVPWFSWRYRIAVGPGHAGPTVWLCAGYRRGRFLGSTSFG